MRNICYNRPCYMVVWHALLHILSMVLCFTGKKLQEHDSTNHWWNHISILLYHCIDIHSNAPCRHFNHSDSYIYMQSVHSISIWRSHDSVNTTHSIYMNNVVWHFVLLASRTDRSQFLWAGPCDTYFHPIIGLSLVHMMYFHLNVA